MIVAGTATAVGPFLVGALPTLSEFEAGANSLRVQIMLRDSLYDEWTRSFYTIWWWLTMRLLGAALGLALGLVGLAVLREEHLRRLSLREEMSARLLQQAQEAQVNRQEAQPAANTATTAATPSTAGSGVSSQAAEAWTVAEVG